MGLNLDPRQRAMLAEMKVPVWWPASDPAPAAHAPAKGEVVGAVAPPPPAAVTAVLPAQAAPVGTDVQTDRPATLASAGAGVPAMDWQALAQTVRACRACALCEGRRAAVFAVEPTPSQCDWLVVGDPPDEHEERAAGPFVGPAGQLLDNMLRAVACQRDGQGRAGARLTNVVKCRPAPARNPQADELAQCAVYLRREVALTQPRVILAMGRLAAMALLSEGEPGLLQVPFGQLRGRVYRFGGVPVVVTYAPAKLLRAPLGKADAWADLCLARALVEQASQN